MQNVNNGVSYKTATTGLQEAILKQSGYGHGQRCCYGYHFIYAPHNVNVH